MISLGWFINHKGDSSRKPKSSGTRRRFPKVFKPKGFFKETKESCAKLRVEWCFGGWRSIFIYFFSRCILLLLWRFFVLAVRICWDIQVSNGPERYQIIQNPKNKIAAETPSVLRSFFISKRWSPKIHGEGRRYFWSCPVKIQVFKAPQQKESRKKVFAGFGLFEVEF